jgi:hypothetical protein
MEIIDADRQENVEINNVLQRIKDKVKKHKIDDYVYFPLITIDNGRVKYNEDTTNIGIINDLKNQNAIEIVKRGIDEMNKTLKEDKKYKNGSLIVEGIFIKPIEPKFSQLCKEFLKKTKSEEKNEFPHNKNSIQSMHLITDSLDPKDTIFIVLDQRFEMPIRCKVNNDKKGTTTYIKKLYNIAYYCDAPGKKVNYDKNLADNINNTLFKKRQIENYMKTHNFTKPTLVQKSENKKDLVLKNEIPIKPMLIKNVPTEHQSLYINKTK